MLICYHNQNRLPQNDLVYLAFLFALHETVAEVEWLSDFDEEEEDMPAGFLIAVPFLHPVPLQVQVELLGEAWSRHRSSTRFEATLLDAAIVYAACMVATRIVNDEPELAAAWLTDGRQKVNPRILHRASERLDDLFDRWWDDRDFLMLEEFHDLPPERAELVKAQLRIPNEMVQPMFDVLERGRVTPGVDQKLVGLLSPKDTDHVVEILMRPPWEARRLVNEITDDDDGESSLEWGLEDGHHDMFVGPCYPETIEKETNCPLVWEIGVGGAEDFDCTHEEWTEHLRDAVHRAAEQPNVKTDPSTFDGDIAEKVKRAMESGLEGGNQIERRDRGWVIVDQTDSYLADVERAVWVVGDDDEKMPPLHFDTAESALLAYDRSQRAAELRAKRRRAAFRRLGKRDGR